MIIFKTFWKIVKKYKGTVILYTMLLIIFGGINMTTSDTNMNFVDSKPDIFIVNQDVDSPLTKNLIKYLENSSNIINIKNNEEAINDAIFYRDVNYVIYIPKNYQKDLLNGQNPTINIKSTKDYQASLAEMILSKYIRIQNIYLNNTKNEAELIKQINNNLNKQTNVEITSKLDTTTTSNMTNYFNFASYSIMAIVIFIICLVMTSFKEKPIRKRTIISSINYKKVNQELLKASFIYSLIVWILFMILGLIMLGKPLISIRGLIYAINSFFFTFCSLTIALLISTLINNKDAISGIVNVVALGSAFLCGAFVPTEWLPQSVLNMAHIFPAYWYINSNDLLKTIETINLTTLTPIFINIIVIIIFSVIFILVNNFASKFKQKIV